MRTAAGFWKFVVSRKRIWLTPILVLVLISLAIVAILRGASIPHFTYRLY